MAAFSQSKARLASRPCCEGGQCMHTADRSWQRAQASAALRTQHTEAVTAADSAKVLTSLSLFSNALRFSLLFSIKQQVARQYSRSRAHTTPQPIPTMASKTSPILFLSFVSSIYALTINTPASVVECQPLQLSWSNGSAPYYLAVIPGVSSFQILVSTSTNS